MPTKKLILEVELDTEGAVKSAKKLGKEMKDTEGRLEAAAGKMEKLNSRLGALASGFGILPVIGAFAALGAMMKSVAEDNEDLQGRLDVTTSALGKTKKEVGEVAAGMFDWVDSMAETANVLDVLTLGNSALFRSVQGLDAELEGFTGKVTANKSKVDELRESYDGILGTMRTTALRMELVGEKTDITSQAFRAMVPELLALKTQMMALGEEATPELEKMFKAAEDIRVQLEAPARAKAAREKAAQEAQRLAQQRIQLEQKVSDEIAKLTLNETDLKRRELAKQLEDFKKTTNDEVAIAKFQEEQAKVLALTIAEIDKEEKEKQLERAQAAQDKLREIQLAGLDATRERIEMENDLLAEGGLAGREVAIFQENLEKLRDLELEKLELKREALISERELAREDHELTLEEEQLFREQLLEIDRQEQEAKDAFAEREKERQAELRAMRVQELAAASNAALAFTATLAKAGLGAKKSAKVEAITTRLSEILAAWVDKAKAASHFAAGNIPQGVAHVFAAGQHLVAAALAGKTSSAVGAQEGGRIPFVPGFAPVGDAIPARLEKDEIVVPRRFTDEFAGFSRFLEEGAGRKMGDTYQIVNPTFLTGDRRAAEEFTVFLEDTRDRLRQDKRMQMAQ